MITLTRFKDRKVKADKVDEFTVNVTTLTDKLPNLQEVMEYLIQEQATVVGKPKYWSFCVYDDEGHSIDSIEECTALLFSYHKDQAANLQTRLKTFPYANYTFQTEGKTSSELALVIPLDVSIRATDYARAAHCVISDLAVYGVRKGSNAATYLVQPTYTATVDFKDGPLIDSHQLVTNTSWNNASLFFRDKGK